MLIAYTGYRVSIFEGKLSVDILQAVSKDYFEYDYTFGADQGLNIAVAVFDPEDPTTYQPIDPKFGRISFQKKVQGIKEDGKYGQLSNEELAFHSCSKEEIGQAGTDSKFFPI